MHKFKSFYFLTSHNFKLCRVLLSLVESLKSLTSEAYLKDFSAATRNYLARNLFQIVKTWKTSTSNTSIEDHRTRTECMLKICNAEIVSSWRKKVPICLVWFSLCHLPNKFHLTQDGYRTSLICAILLPNVFTVCTNMRVTCFSVYFKIAQFKAQYRGI